MARGARWGAGSGGGGRGGSSGAAPPATHGARRALEFWFRGSNSGATIRVEVQDNRSDPATDTAERWEYQFTDDSADWRYVSIPWTSFTRRADWQPAGGPHGGLRGR